MDIIIEVLQYWKKGGWLLIPLALVCCSIIYYLIRMNQRLKVILLFSNEEETEIQKALNDRNPLGKIEQIVNRYNCYFADIIHYILCKLHANVDPSAIFNEIRQKELAPFDRDLIVLKALVTAAPLLGLLGTVFGMIGTFEAIAHKSSETTELMASGISQGLLTTQFGLIVAIPGIFGINMLTKKIELLQSKLSNLQIHFATGLRRVK